MANDYTVAIRQFGGIGDYLMLSPVFRGIKEAAPELDLHLISSSDYMNGALLQIAAHNPFIDAIYDIPPTLWTTPETRRYHKDLRDVQDSIDINTILEPALAVTDFNNVCIHRELSSAVQLHRTRIWCEHAGVAPSSMKPVYQIRDEERAWASKAIKTLKDHDGQKVIGIALSATHQGRTIHPSVVIKLIDRLKAEGYSPVTISENLGVPGCRGINPESSEALPYIIALLEQMDAVVSPDSGVLHMAGAVGTTVVGVFGMIPPGVRMEFYHGAAVTANDFACMPCWYEPSCLSLDPEHHYGCMKHVSADEIFEAVRTLVD